MKAQPFPLLFCVMLTLSAVLSSAEFLGSLDELELDAVKYGIVIEGKPVKQVGRSSYEWSLFTIFTIISFSSLTSTYIVFVRGRKTLCSKSPLSGRRRWR